MPSVSTAKSILFLSADLVGSTSYKQQTSAGWQKIFLSFYREFPQAVKDANRRHAASTGHRVEFELWKAIGDELIFRVDVRQESDVSAAVRVWLEALAAYEQGSLEEVPLALKGGAFIATFPGPDSESSIPKSPETETSDASVVALNDIALKGRRNNTKYLFDYFGPSIDTGFRVIGLATQRYFTMSIEVAWAIAHAASANDLQHSNSTPHHVRDVVFQGRQSMKGVWRGQEYPLFAIDRDHASPFNRALAKLVTAELDAQKIAHVCEACSESDGWPSKLYLPDSRNDRFCVIPEDAMEQLRQAEAPPFDDAPNGEDGEDLGIDVPLS